MTADTGDGWSATALDVQERLHERRETGETAALATVVDVEGSAFRRPGAKMVLTPDGGQIGAVTAGCLEGPVSDLAAGVYDTGEPVLQTFDLMDDDEWGLGLGCNGVIDVFVEPVDASLDRALTALADGETVALATVVESSTSAVDAGARAFLADDGLAAVEGRPPLPEEVVDTVEPLARDCAERATTTIEEVDLDDGTVRVFVDGIEPPPELLLFGGQPDSVPVVRLARETGFRVTVATARGGLGDPERFPGAERVITTRPDEIGDHVDGDTSVVLMSHNLIDDELALAALVDTAVPYVGLMGPRERFERIREDLRSDDVVLPDEFLERVATPVGLDLGGGAPMEIALSIVAEVLAVRNDRQGGQLSEREGPIHGERE